MFPQNAKKISCLFSDLPDELKGKFEENEENKTFYNTPNWVLNTAKTFIKDKDKGIIVCNEISDKDKEKVKKAAYTHLLSNIKVTSLEQRI